MKFTTIGAIATAATLAVVAPASAITLDFTDDTVGTPNGGTANGPVTGSFGIVDWEVTANNNPSLNRNERYNGGEAVGSLVLDNDGFGVSNDEANNPTSTGGNLQTITVTFSKKVKLTDVTFLDVYTNPDNGITESARMLVASGATTDTPFDAEVFGTDSNPDGGSIFGAGDAMIVGSWLGTSFTFFAGPGREDGTADISLAAMTVSAVPLPAGVLLLGTAIGGLGIARRRKKA